jgi:hypothetical protein
MEGRLNTVSEITEVSHKQQAKNSLLSLQLNRYGGCFCISEANGR